MNYELTNQPSFQRGNNGHACLLLHGLGGGVFELELLAKKLLEHGYTVCSITYPGHEQNSNIMPPSSWKDWYQHILNTYNMLKEKYNNISLVGFSTGCPLSLRLALEKQVDKLILLSPFLKLKHKAEYIFTLEQYVHTFAELITNVPRHLTRLNDPLMREAIKKVLRFRTFNLKAVKSAIELINQVKPKLSQISRPTLIIHSEKDHVVDPVSADILYKELGSQKKELHWLKNSYHTITLDIEKDYVHKLILEFLS